MLTADGEPKVPEQSLCKQALWLSVFSNKDLAKGVHVLNTVADGSEEDAAVLTLLGSGSRNIVCTLDDVEAIRHLMSRVCFKFVQDDFFTVAAEYKEIASLTYDFNGPPSLEKIRKISMVARKLRNGSFINLIFTQEDGPEVREVNGRSVRILQGKIDGYRSIDYIAHATANAAARLRKLETNPDEFHLVAIVDCMGETIGEGVGGLREQTGVDLPYVVVMPKYSVRFVNKKGVTQTLLSLQLLRKKTGEPNKTFFIRARKAYDPMTLSLNRVRQELREYVKTYLDISVGHLGNEHSEYLISLLLGMTEDEFTRWFYNYKG